MKKTNLNSKSAKYMRDHGYIAEIVERNIPGTKYRKDLFNCIDVLAVGNGKIKFIQVTSRDHAASRRRKVLDSHEMKEVSMSYGLIELHLWKKKGSRWTLDIENIDPFWEMSR